MSLPKPEPIPSLVDFEDRILSFADVISEDSEQITLEVEWNGCGLIWHPYLEPNQNYAWSVDIEIISKEISNAFIRGGLYNLTKDTWNIYSIFESSLEIGVRQSLSGTFNTGDISPTDSLELELVQEISDDGYTHFKVYKDSFKFVKE